MIERIWWQIITKKKKNLIDIFIMLFLYILSGFYFFGLLIKDVLYKLNIKKPLITPYNIITIGNLTLGGTGKTSITIEIAKRIIKSGKKLMVVAKGYKRKKINDIDIVSNGSEILLSVKNSGDEPYMLARNLKDACVLVGENKIKTIEYGLQIFKPDYVLLDDGFQKRKDIKKSINILLIDALNPFGFNSLFPAGMLREPIHALREADVIIITNTNIIDDPQKIDKIKDVIYGYDKNAKILEADIQPKYVYNIFTDEHHAVEFLNNKKVICFSGIGNPIAFERTLKMLNAHIVVGLRFKDHHTLLKKEIEAMCKLLQKTNASMIITTEKDEVKLKRKFFTDNRVFCLKTGVLIKNIKELDKKIKLQI
ncbi:MAG: tetraacyldisaccharide 4'-kinase [Candidatus Goldbacteria bacterium]|nr:tetraacyldisaccharide 4'-kinase [Candidatus Goldiibacteriota bacterium]